MFTYLGTLVVGPELVKVLYQGRMVRFVTMDRSGNHFVHDELIEGTLPMRIACLRRLLESMVPGLKAHPVHAGVGGSSFFLDFANAQDALILETQD